MTTASIKNYSNLLYDALRQYPIVDLAPVFDRGVRGRTMSGRGSNWLHGTSRYQADLYESTTERIKRQSLYRLTDNYYHYKNPKR